MLMENLEKSSFEIWRRNESIKLLCSFREEKASLCLPFLCNFCLGILINPITCKRCNGSFCQKCFNRIVSNPNLSLFCFCKKCDIGIFSQIQDYYIPDTFYLFEHPENNKMSRELDYLQALQSISCLKPRIYPTNFVAESNEIFSKDLWLERYNKEKEQIYRKLIRPNTYNPVINQKIIKMLKFNFHKGYNLSLCSKVLSRRIPEISLLLLNSFNIKNCIMSIESALSFSKLIIRNTKKLKTISIDNSKYFLNIPQAILLKAILLCENLTSLKIIKRYMEPSHKDKFINLTGYFNTFCSKEKLLFLCLKNWNFTSMKEIQFLGNCTLLRSLKATNSNFSLESSILFLECIKNLKYFSSLNLWKPFVEKSSFEGNYTDQLQTLLNKYFYNINMLTLGYLDDYDHTNEFILSFFKSLINFRNLEILKIKFQYRLDEEISKVLLSFLSKNHRLKQFSIKQTKRTVAWIEKELLNEIIKYENFEALKIENLDLTEVYDKLIIFIKNCRNIKKLTMKNCSIIVKPDIVDAALQKTTLTLLNLENNCFSQSAYGMINKSISLKIKIGKDFLITEN